MNKWLTKWSIKKVALVFIIAVVTVFICSGPGWRSFAAGKITRISPHRKTVCTANPKIRKWFRNYRRGTSAKYFKKGENSWPVPVRLRWRSGLGRGALFTVRVSKNRSMKGAVTYRTKKKYLDLHEPESARTYYWTVTGKNAGKAYTSKVKRFRVAAYPRTIKVGGVSNVRDFGGYSTPYGRIKQGVVYQSANLDKITKAGKKKLLKKLRVRTDLDLRKTGEGTSGKGSPLGKTVRYRHRSGVMYDEVWKNKKNRKRLVNEVRVFVSKKNYPVMFHCTYGRDRTGTLAFTVGGLLGMNKKDLYRNYELSFFSVMGSHGSKTVDERLKMLDSLYRYFRTYRSKEHSLRWNIERFLLDNGMEKREIKAVRKNLVNA
ncbi:MAG: tyrosine-protein phosphatase [Eubacterium sp.]|nr:tyrosine-protein phosphatase [Eubacterium sp.]